MNVAYNTESRSDISPEDEADLRNSLERRGFRDRALEVEMNLVRSDLEYFVRFQGPTWRASLASDITWGNFRPPVSRRNHSLTMGEVISAWEDAYNRAKAEDGVHPWSEGNVDLARSYLTEVSDYRIWKIVQECEDAGRDALADNLWSMAISDREGDHRMVGRAVRKKYLEIVSRITGEDHE